MAQDNDLRLVVGTRLEVVDVISYKHRGTVVDLPVGLRGTVSLFDGVGDAFMDWEDKTLLPKWLLRDSFLKVKVVESTLANGFCLPVDAEGDFKVVIEKTDNGEKVGITVVHLGKTCLLVQELREGLISSYNGRNENVPEIQLISNDIIVAVNGVSGDVGQMTKQLAEERSLTLTVKRGNRPVNKSLPLETTAPPRPPEVIIDTVNITSVDDEASATKGTNSYAVAGLHEVDPLDRAPVSVEVFDQKQVAEEIGNETQKGFGCMCF
jgi:hypothetical protein